MNSLLLVTILAAIVLIFIAQMRREIRQKRKQAFAQTSQGIRPAVLPAPAQLAELPMLLTQETSVKTTQPVVSASAEMMRETPALVEELPAKSAEAMLHKRRAKQKTPKAAASAARVTAVLGLLQDRDSVATAFVLSEIFAGPRSRQRR